jgi:hypothetical protein
MAWQATQASAGCRVDAFTAGGVAAFHGLGRKRDQLGAGKDLRGGRDPGDLHERLDEGGVAAALACEAERLLGGGGGQVGAGEGRGKAVARARDAEERAPGGFELGGIAQGLQRVGDVGQRSLQVRAGEGQHRLPALAGTGGSLHESG